MDAHISLNLPCAKVVCKGSCSAGNTKSNKRESVSSRPGLYELISFTVEAGGGKSVFAKLSEQ